MKISVNNLLVSSVVLASLTACGQVLDSVGKSDADYATTQEPQELIDINVNVEEDGATGFALAAASEFSISLEGCASGYTSTASQLQDRLNVYKFDRGCLAKLTSLKYNGITYTPSADAKFTTWAAGDAATFSDGGTNQIKVVVSAQLSNPVGLTDTVAYSFTEIVAGSGQVFSTSAVGAPKSMSVGGQAAPSFIVKTLAYTGMTSTGAGEFSFNMECTQASTGSGLDQVCNDLKASQLKYVLIKDETSGVLTAAQASALFVAAGTSVGVAEVRAQGTAGLTNGGFATTGLVGPAQMHANPNMILVVEGAGTSYLYFNVDVSTISQATDIAP